MTSVLVPSMTRAGPSWWVNRRGDAWVCECPAYHRARRTTGKCKHVELVEKAQHVLTRCADTHGSDGDHACYRCVVALMAISARKVRRDYVPKKQQQRRRG